MTDAINEKVAELTDKTLILLDDDAPFRQRLARALEARGFQVTMAESVAEALTIIAATPPAFGVMDMRLEDGNGLKAVEALHAKRPDARAKKAET